MGGVLSWVGGVIGGVIGTPFVWLDAIFGTDFFKGLIEPIMNFLGFEDEDIYSIDVITVRVYDEDLYTKVMQDLHLEYMAKGYGSIDYSTNFAKSGDNQFGRYYRTGKWEYMDYLPTGQINAVSLDRDGIVKVLEEIEETEVFIADIGNRTPPDDVWARYQLQQLYDYNIGTDVLKYDDLWYHFEDVTYRTSDNTFDVTIATIPVINAKTYKATTITVTPIDDLTDNKNTLITSDVLYTDNVTGNVLHKTSTVVSNIDTVIPKDSEKDSYTNEFVSEENIEIPAATAIINIPMHANVMHYIVEYTRKDTGRFKYWIYNPQTNQYPIANPNSKSVNFEMFPIVMLRNNKTNVADMDKNSKRYKQTSKMLKSIGVDIHEITKGYSDNPDIDKVQDAFFVLGISPSDTNPIVSKCLYEMFDAVYDTTPFADINTSYAMSVKEDPYNASIAWNTGDVSVHTGTIYKGALAGDCNHTISGDSLTMQKQLTKTTYKRIVITNFRAISIVRADKPRGKDLPLGDKNLILPLAIPVVARLTLMEKTALLGRSVHLTFYAVQHTHLKWYETEKFANAMKIAMIVIMIVLTVVVTVVTWGSGTWATLTAFNAAMMFLEAVAVAVAVHLALKLIATFVDDPALKAALSLVVMVIAIYVTMGADFGMNGLTALQLSSACVNAAAMYMGDIVADDLDEFQQDVDKFTQKYDERSKQQQEIMKGLDMGSKSFDMVDLTTDIDMFSTASSQNKRIAAASLLSPSQFYYLATNQAAYNYDLLYSGLYDNTVHDFVANRLQLGIPGA